MEKRLTDRKNNIRAYTAKIAHDAAHVAAHVAAAVAAVGLRYDLTPPRLVLAALGAALPDVDVFLPLAHRTVTHSLLALGVVFLAGRAVLGESLAVTLAVGYGSHIAVDLLHGLGVQLLWPARRFFSITTTLSAATVAAAALTLLLLLKPSASAERTDWRIEKARIQAEKAALVAKHKCEVAGSDSYECQLAQLEFQIANAEYCALAKCR